MCFSVPFNAAAGYTVARVFSVANPASAAVFMAVDTIVDEIANAILGTSGHKNLIVNLVGKLITCIPTAVLSSYITNSLLGFAIPLKTAVLFAAASTAASIGITIILLGGCIAALLAIDSSRNNEPFEQQA